MLASGIKGMRTKLRFGSELPSPLLCGGAWMPLLREARCAAADSLEVHVWGLIKVLQVVQELFLGLKSLD